MISLQILEIKNFMTKLLAKGSFDHFHFSEVSVTTFNTFTINGILHKAYYECDKELLEDSQKYSYWREIRPFCYDLIKGKHLPLQFKMVFLLCYKELELFLSEHDITISPSDIGGVFLNIHYDASGLFCTTGTSVKLFTLDKSLDYAWENHIQDLLKKLSIPFIIL